MLLVTLIVDGFLGVLDVCLFDLTVWFVCFGLLVSSVVGVCWFD